MAISSPCKRLCHIHPEHHICTGCGRTLSEIQNWLNMPEKDRLYVMDQLEARISSEKRLIPDE